jgi:hypothetical protein
LQNPRFTPLNTSIVEVFIEIRRDLAFKWPEKLKDDLTRRDPWKFYKYHDAHGHLIEECITFHREIEKYI